MLLVTVSGLSIVVETLLVPVAEPPCFLVVFNDGRRRSVIVVFVFVFGKRKVYPPHGYFSNNEDKIKSSNSPVVLFKILFEEME